MTTTVTFSHQWKPEKYHNNIRRIMGPFRSNFNSFKNMKITFTAAKQIFRLIQYLLFDFKLFTMHMYKWTVCMASPRYWTFTYMDIHILKQFQHCRFSTNERTNIILEWHQIYGVVFVVAMLLLSPPDVFVVHCGIFQFIQTWLMQSAKKKCVLSSFIVNRIIF